MTFLICLLFAVAALVFGAVLDTVADKVGVVCLRHNGNVSLEIELMAAKA